MDGWVGQWVGSGQMTNNLINLDLIDIYSILFEVFMICRDTPTHGWVYGWWVGQWVNGWGQVK